MGSDLFELFKSVVLVFLCFFVVLTLYRLYDIVRLFQRCLMFRVRYMEEALQEQELCENPQWHAVDDEK